MLRLFLFILFFTHTINSFGQPLEKKTVNFLEKHGHEINLVEDAQLKEFKFLDKILKDKRIVLLGEFTHGSKEINLVKNEMIKYLHETLGYNVLLFESGIGELMSMEWSKTKSSTNELINMGLFGPWRTQEYVALLQYVKTHQELSIGGFDVQRSGQRFAKQLEQTLKSVNLEPNTDVQKLEKSHADLIQLMRRTSFDQKMQDQYQEIVLQYHQLHDQIAANKLTLETEEGGNTKTAFILKTIENRLAHLRYFVQFKQDNDYQKRWSARDSIMAANIIWMLENIYPNEKVIINAHNFHISKYNQPLLTMGEVLAEEYPDDIYSIGIFGGQGELANNSRQPEELSSPTEQNDIKWFIQASPWENTFIHISKSHKKGRRWLQEEVIVNDSFLDLSRGNKLIPKACYDGLIFIKNISPPVYLR